MIYAIGWRLSFQIRKAGAFTFTRVISLGPARISRLLLAAFLAFVWMIYLGLDVLAQGKRSLIDWTHRRDRSIFRLGTDWLKYLLKYVKSIPIQFRIPEELITNENVRWRI